jgi:hypothetical protein
VFRGLHPDGSTAMTTATATTTGATRMAAAPATAVPLPPSLAPTYERFVAPCSHAAPPAATVAADRPLFDVLQDARARRAAEEPEAPRGSEAALLPVRGDDEVRADAAFLQTIEDAERQRRQDLRGEEELALDEFRRARANGASDWEDSAHEQARQVEGSMPAGPVTASSRSPQQPLPPPAALLHEKHSASRPTAPATILRNRLVVTKKRKRDHAQDRPLNPMPPPSQGSPDLPEASQQTRDAGLSFLVGTESVLVPYGQDPCSSSSSTSSSGNRYNRS